MAVEMLLYVRLGDLVLFVDSALAEVQVRAVCASVFACVCL